MKSAVIVLEPDPKLTKLFEAGGGADGVEILSLELDSLVAFNGWPGPWPPSGALGEGFFRINSLFCTLTGSSDCGGMKTGMGVGDI
jgi:hypothetical protein